MEGVIQYKWINTNRKGMCHQCDTQIQIGERVLWSLTDKAIVWCRRCGSTIALDDVSKGVEQSPVVSVASNANGGNASTAVDATTEGVCPLPVGVPPAKMKWVLIMDENGVVDMRRLP